MPNARPHLLLSALACALLPRLAFAASCTVPTDPGCATVQAALDQAVAGDTVTLAAGTYFEKVQFPNSGGPGSYITLTGAPGHTSILDGTGVTGPNLIEIASRSYIKVIGLTLRNNLGVSDGSGIRITGSGSHIELRDNLIHDIRGSDAMGITVYGTEATSISHLIIDGNEIRDSEPARSEALTLNGNVELFEVTNNYVHDVNNIGIDFIGGETDIQPDSSKVARNGLCAGNRVYRARSIYEGGYAGAIYVDGGRDIVIERNVTSESDLGLEVGAENAGITTRNITVRDNVIYNNDKVGIVFGGFNASVGRVEDSTFTNNTLYGNDTLGTGVGEFWIQYASNNTIANNLVYATRAVLLYSEAGNTANTLHHNLWYTDATPEYVWNGTLYSSLASFQAGSGEDAGSLFADPQLTDPTNGDLHLTALSPAIDAGDPAFVPGSGELDIDGSTRVSGGRVDIGADEFTCGDGNLDDGEICDDNNLVDCDGCDSNCTLTSECGNGILCGAEQCDDGNAANGDCCGTLCNFEIATSVCDDGDLCTNGDQCDGAGTCTGVSAPAAICKAPTASDRATLLLSDSADAARDKLVWKWTKGEAVALAELGEPDTTTTYALCLYDASANPQPRWSAVLPPGPRWSEANTGYRFRDRDGTTSGLQSVKLKAGDLGKTSASVSGKGTGLAPPPLPLPLPVTVQLRNSDGACWGATFGEASRNDATTFKARGE